MPDQVGRLVGVSNVGSTLHRVQLALDDDQQFFQETTRKFLEQEMPVTAVRALADDPAGFDRAWWMRGAELGWTSLLVPEADGGGSLSGQGVLDLLIVAEEMGRLVSPGPLLPTSVAALALAEGGSAELRGEVLPRIMSGELVASWCPVLPGNEGMSVTAEERDGAFVLTGTAAPVEAAAHADELLVTATTERGTSQFLVSTDSPGVTIEPLGSVDLVRRFAAVHFDAVAVPAPRLVGVADAAAPAAARQLQLAVVLQCAETVGALDRVLEFTLEYLADRTSFGRPLASYQALKHRVADMKMWLEAAHGVTELAAPRCRSTPTTRRRS